MIYTTQEGVWHNHRKCQWEYMSRAGQCVAWITDEMLYRAVPEMLLQHHSHVIRAIAREAFHGLV